MIKGMTGFGGAQVTCPDVSATVEIKSVNHRYLDVNYYLPHGFSSLEDRLRKTVQKQLSRGRVTISIKITQKAQQKISVNKEAVKSYIYHINKLKKEFSLSGDVELSDILKLQGVLDVKETTVSPTKIAPEVDRALAKALKSLVNMRKREGASLAKDIKGQLKIMSVRLKKIEQRSKSLLKSSKRKLTAEEFSSYQKSSDINEEIARLAHYIQELAKLLMSNKAIGKKIDFIGQEMQREINTIGSKVQDKIVSDAVISLKSKVEKIREQAQNIE